MAKINQLVKAYTNIRDAKSAATRMHKDTIGVMDEQMAVLATEIHKTLNELGVESMKTSAGTAFLTTKDFVNVAEIEDFRMFLAESVGDEANDERAQFIFDHFPWHFLTKALSKDAVKQYMSDHEGVPPAGVKYDKSVEVQIRK